MKAVIFGLASVLLAALALGDPATGEELAPTVQPAPVVEGFADLVGTWYAFPAGALISFDGHGRLHFGDPATGYKADSWFAGDLLHVRFTNYDGDDEQCRNETGVYAVTHNGDLLRFEGQSDPCQVRWQMLTGRDDFQPELQFHWVG
jgi:hypothetical protein